MKTLLSRSADNGLPRNFDILTYLTHVIIFVELVGKMFFPPNSKTFLRCVLFRVAQ